MTFLLYIAAGILLVNLLYYLLFIYFGYSSSPKPETDKIYPVSLVVCAKNEAQNLKNNIPRWLGQNHPNFELVLIDDASTDETAEVILSFAEQDPRISAVYVKANERFHNSKKYALTLGIKKARHTRLVFTDADCIPVSENWLKVMSQYFSAEKQLVLGYGAYRRKFSLLNVLIRFETFMTAIQYFSYAKAGNPYMGVGRNLGYTAVLFEQQKGFADHMQLRSGDDDLFVNKAANSENTTSCLDPIAFTISEPKSTFNGWFGQKRRHISTAKYYKPKQKIALAAYYLGNVAFWLVLGLLMYFEPNYGMIFLGARTLLQWIAYYGASQKLKCRDLVLAAPLLELFLIILQLSIFSANLVSPKPSWK